MYNILKCEYAGIGRQARLRGVCDIHIWVQVPLLAPELASQELRIKSEK